MGWWDWLTRNRPEQGPYTRDLIEEHKGALTPAKREGKRKLPALHTVSIPVISPDLSEHHVSFTIREVNPEAFRTTSGNFEGKCRDIIRNLAGAEDAAQVMMDLYRSLVLGNYTTYNGKGGKVPRAALEQTYPEQGALPGFVQAQQQSNTSGLIVYNLLHHQDSGHLGYAILGGILVQMLQAGFLSKPKLPLGHRHRLDGTAMPASAVSTRASPSQEQPGNQGEVPQALPELERDDIASTVPQEVNHPGFIYILVNPSYRQHLLKIGKTTRLPESRAEEITNATGVPTRFYVAYDKQVANCHAVERLVHRRLHSFRVAHNREFFALPLKEAIAVIEEIAEQFQP